MMLEALEFDSTAVTRAWEARSIPNGRTKIDTSFRWVIRAGLGVGALLLVSKAANRACRGRFFAELWNNLHLEDCDYDYDEQNEYATFSPSSEAAEWLRAAFATSASGRPVCTFTVVPFGSAHLCAAASLEVLWENRFVSGLENNHCRDALLAALSAWVDGGVTVVVLQALSLLVATTARADAGRDLGWQSSHGLLALLGCTDVCESFLTEDLKALCKFDARESLAELEGGAQVRDFAVHVVAAICLEKEIYASSGLVAASVLRPKRDCDDDWPHGLADHVEDLAAMVRDRRPSSAPSAVELLAGLARDDAHRPKVAAALCRGGKNFPMEAVLESIWEMNEKAHGKARRILARRRKKAAEAASIPERGTETDARAAESSLLALLDDEDKAVATRATKGKRRKKKTAARPVKPETPAPAAPAREYSSSSSSEESDDELPLSTFRVVRKAPRPKRTPAVRSPREEVPAPAPAAPPPPPPEPAAPPPDALLELLGHVGLTRLHPRLVEEEIATLDVARLLKACDLAELGATEAEAEAFLGAVTVGGKRETGELLFFAKETSIGFVRPLGASRREANVCVHGSNFAGGVPKRGALVTFSRGTHRGRETALRVAAVGPAARPPAARAGLASPPKTPQRIFRADEPPSPPDVLGDAAPPARDAASSNECPCCLTEGARDSALVPCGHVLCASCVARYGGRECPVCRQACTGIMRIFL